MTTTEKGTNSTPEEGLVQGIEAVEASLWIVPRYHNGGTSLGVREGKEEKEDVESPSSNMDGDDDEWNKRLEECLQKTKEGKKRKITHILRHKGTLWQCIAKEVAPRVQQHCTLDVQQTVVCALLEMYRAAKGGSITVTAKPGALNSPIYKKFGEKWLEEVQTLLSSDENLLKKVVSVSSEEEQRQLTLPEAKEELKKLVVKILTVKLSEKLNYFKLLIENNFIGFLLKLKLDPLIKPMLRLLCDPKHERFHLCSQVQYWERTGKIPSSLKNEKKKKELINTWFETKDTKQQSQEEGSSFKDNDLLDFEHSSDNDFETSHSLFSKETNQSVVSTITSNEIVSKRRRQETLKSVLNTESKYQKMEQQQRQQRAQDKKKKEEIEALTATINVTTPVPPSCGKQAATVALKNFRKKLIFSANNLKAIIRLLTNDIMQDAPRVTAAPFTQTWKNTSTHLEQYLIGIILEQKRNVPATVLQLLVQAVLVSKLLKQTEETETSVTDFSTITFTWSDLQQNLTTFMTQMKQTSFVSE